MTIEEICEEFYEELSGQIVSVERQGSGLKLFFTCLDWVTGIGDRRFEILIDDAVEHAIQLGYIWHLGVLEDHPLLWKHNMESASIYFSTAPENTFELLGRLYEAHARIFQQWRPMRQFVHANSGILAGGYGQLANGPRRLIEEFASVANPFLRFTIVPGRPTSAAYRVMMLGDNFVIFKGQVRVVEVTV